MEIKRLFKAHKRILKRQRKDTEEAVERLRAEAATFVKDFTPRVQVVLETLAQELREQGCSAEVALSEPGSDPYVSLRFQYRGLPANISFKYGPYGQRTMVGQHVVVTRGSDQRVVSEFRIRDSSTWSEADTKTIVEKAVLQFLQSIQDRVREYRQQQLYLGPYPEVTDEPGFAAVMEMV